MALRVSVGQYYAADSPVHALDPRVKVVAAVVYMVSCFFVHGAAALAWAALAIFGTVLAARVPVRLLLRSIRPVMLFLAVTSVINLFFVHTGSVVLQLGPVVVHSGGVSAAVLYTLRFLFLLMAGALLMLTTTATALADAVERLGAPLERVGVPVRQTALILSIALRFVPILGQEADNVRAAQIARGADLEQKGALAYVRACVPLVVPLFAGALRHADNLGRAMEARCYTGGPDRTHFHALRFELRRDGVFLALLVCYVAVLAALVIALP